MGGPACQKVWDDFQKAEVDEDFIIDQHPEHPRVSIAAGFSGHGFKFSSVAGEILSEMSTAGNTKHDISIFSLPKAALQQPL
ncbi:FAD-dependent oxidoreductase [Bacillus swezeyi]|uniref:FAD-dependent oxidoreductase n=1 Tax=Bacillus swezeyi TaxID=1925020 RepID=UPI00399C8FD9